MCSDILPGTQEGKEKCRYIWCYCYPDNANAKGETLGLTVVVLKANGEGKWQSSKVAFVLV